MKKVLSKTIVGMMLVAIATTSGAVISEAYSVDNGNKKFKSEWELSTTCDDKKGILIYGFDTNFTDEDYAKAYHTKRNHYAYLKNGNGSVSGSNKKKGEWSTAEATHKGSKITYGISY